MATFITSKTSGQWLMGVHVRTTSGWWTYTHNGVTSFARQAGQYNYHDIQVQSNDGEFTIISCNSDGSPNGSITHIFLQDGNLTSFDVTGLSALTELNISINQLTSFNGTGLSSLTSLILNNNNLNIISNLPTTLTYLSLGQNQLTQFDATGLSNLSTLALGNNQLTEFDGTELSNLSELYLSNNQINVSNLVLPIGLNYLEISNNNLTSLDNDSILSLLAENATNLNITGGQFFTTGERTSIGTPYYNTLVNNLSWNIEGAYLSTPLIFKTYDNSSSEFSPQNVVVNFDPSTKTWSVWGSLQSDGGMLGGFNWEEIGNIGTLSSIDNGDGTWQVIYEFEYNYPSSYSWFQVRSSGGEDTLQVTTEIIEFSASATGVNYNGDVNQLNFVLQDQWYGETLLSGTLSSTETAVGVYDLVYTFSAPSIVNISNPFIAIFENYGGENQTSIMSSIVVTAEQTTTTTTTTEEPTTTTTTTSGLTPTFVTSKSVGEVVFLNVNSSTGYWKYYHNDIFSGVYGNNWDGNGNPVLSEILNANGEFTIIPCDSEGNESGHLTGLGLWDNQLTSFDGTGLSSLEGLNLDGNQLTSFNGTGLSGLTFLTLVDNPLTSFNGGDMGLITSLSFPQHWNINTLTGFTAGNMTNLTTLDLSNNQITSFSGTGLSNLEYLSLVGNQLTSFNGTGLSGLTYLDLGGNQLTSFNGTGLFSLTNLGLYYNQLTEFTTTDLGNLLVLGLSRNQLTSFNGTGLTNLTTLSLADNPLTSFDGTDLGNLSQLNFMSEILINRISSLDNFIFPTNLNSLNLNYNQISSFDGSVFTNLQSLQLEGNEITSLDNFVLPTTLTNLSFSGNPKVGLSNYLTEFDGTGLPALTHLFLRDNQLTSFIGTGLSSLTDLELRGNQITSFDGNGLTSLIVLDLLSNPITPEVNDSILDVLESYGLTNGNFSTENGRTSAGTSDYDTLISRGWNISGADLAEETTTTTTTVAPPITHHSLTFRKISYGDNSPKNAPLTISEFEGNFAYLSDYVNHLLGVIDGLNVTVTNLQSENQSLSNRVTNIENGGANN